MQCSVQQLRELISEAIRKAYEILGVDQAATPEQIKKAYLKKAVQLHPDRNTGQDTAAEMVKVNVAYGLLSDPDKKRKYDVAGDKTLGDVGSSGGLGGSSDWWTRKPTEKKPQSTSSWADDWMKKNGPPPPKTDAEWAAEEARKWREGEQVRKQQQSSFVGRQYFTYSRGSSNKFWWVERAGARGTVVTVGYGRLGSLPKIKDKIFKTPMMAQRFVQDKILEKMKKGYVQSDAPWSRPSEEEYARKSASQPQQRSAPSQKSSTAKGSPKSTYKIYGRRGQAPVHTRFKGQVYSAAPGTKFRNGDQASVSVGADGKLNVKDPKTGHTQNWDTSESVFQKLVDDMMFLNESLFVDATD